MGQMKNISIILQNKYPDAKDHDKIFTEFMVWLNDDEKNMMFVTSYRPGVYLDLCNNIDITLEDVFEYWMDNVRDDSNNTE